MVYNFSNYYEVCVMVKAINLISLINEENDNLNQIEPGELFEQNSVSELQMHKILYILFGLFYKNLIRIFFLKLILKLENKVLWKLILEDH